MADQVVVPRMPNPRALAERAFDYVRATPLSDVTAVMTFFLALFFGFEAATFKITVQVALLIVLFQPALLRNPWLWSILAASATYALVRDWSVADNHKYLLVYWLWVMAFVFGFPDEDDRERVIVANARFFLIFIFLAAALQKLCSSTYMSGAMFELRILLDERFRAFAHLMGVEGNLLDHAGKTMTTLRSPLLVFEDNTLDIGSTDRIRMLSVAMTWYDLVVQVLIGALFLVRRRMTDIAGHALLLFFIFTTYLPAPVFGFGWTLAILGFAISKRPYPRIAMMYLVSCLAVLAYQTPWREWVLSS